MAGKAGGVEGGRGAGEEMVESVELGLKKAEALVAGEVGMKFAEIDDGGEAVGGVGEDAAFAVEDAASGRGFEKTAEALAFGGGGVFVGTEELVTGERGEEKQEGGGEEEAEGAEAVVESRMIGKVGRGLRVEGRIGGRVEGGGWSCGWSGGGGIS